MPFFYKHGVSSARKFLGLEPEENHTARNIAVGGLAAAPFAGLIGQKAITKDPHTNPNIRRTTIKELEALAQPGDIVAASKPQWGGWKLVQSPLSETEFYHTQPVVTKNKKSTTVATAGELYEPGRKPLTTLAAKRRLDTLRADALSQQYHNLVLLRPNEPIPPDQIKLYQKELLRRAQTPYGVRHGVRAFIRDLLIPKLKLFEERSPVCEGNVCSTYPSQAHKVVTGKNLVHGKPARSVLTADYLREGSGVTPIAAHISKPARFSPRTMKMLNLGLRGGLGLGLAGGTYALSEDPTLAAAPLGAALTPMVGRRIASKITEHRARQAATATNSKITPKLLLTARKKGYNFFRPVGHMVNYLGDSSQIGRTKLKGIGTRTIPLALAGGLASYLAARAGKKALND